ncbi:MAG TPA: hypothetical protein VN687_04925 [Blastocatellia bacterium]|nr:hypothetical protein [Blastocatellia bacterium]
MNPRSRIASIVFALILLLSAYNLASAQTPDRSSAASGVSSFYTFHLAHKKDFTAANIRLRRPWLTPEFYGLFLGELKRQAEYSKAHPDEAPDFEGDPFTDSQEYPGSFRVGTVITNGNRAKATVTFSWSAKTNRGVDSRNITVELIKLEAGWLINDIFTSDGSSVRDALKKKS